MRTLWTIVLVGLLGACPVVADQTIRLAEEISVPLPEGWLLTTDSSVYPFQLVSNEFNAELLIFRTVFPPEDAIGDETELQRSVQDVIDEVIPNLPAAELVSSVGYHELYRAIFVLDFNSLDTTEYLAIHHRLRGILYRLPEGRQLLFILWAKTGMGQFESFEADIAAIQEGFVFDGPYEPQVFGSARPPLGYMALAVLAVFGLLFLFRSFRSRHDRVHFAGDSHFWRCECGRANHAENAHCRRCGRQQTPISTT